MVLVLKNSVHAIVKYTGKWSSTYMYCNSRRSQQIEVTKLTTIVKLKQVPVSILTRIRPSNEG